MDTLCDMADDLGGMKTIRHNILPETLNAGYRTYAFGTERSLGTPNCRIVVPPSGLFIYQVETEERKTAAQKVRAECEFRPGYFICFTH